MATKSTKPSVATRVTNTGFYVYATAGEVLGDDTVLSSLFEHIGEAVHDSFTEGWDEIEVFELHTVGKYRRRSGFEKVE